MSIRLIDRLARRSVDERVTRTLFSSAGPSLLLGVAVSHDFGIDFGMVMHIPFTLTGARMIDLDQIRLRMASTHKLFIG